jgi:hypothetical protein
MCVKIRLANGLNPAFELLSFQWLGGLRTVLADQKI